MASAPTLPYVVLKAHKPQSPNDILAATANAGHQRSLTGEESSGRSNSSPLNNNTGSGPSSTSSTTAAASSAGRSNSHLAIHSRTLHPQVHYLFENDPLETEILEGVQKYRSITLDLDPRTGTVKNVESFMTGFQVMDVRLVPLHDTAAAVSSPPPSVHTDGASASGSRSGTGIGATPRPRSFKSPSGSPSPLSPPPLPRTLSSERSTPSNAAHINTTTTSSSASSASSLMTASTRFQRREGSPSIGESSVSAVSSGGNGEEKGPMAGYGKDWTLLIDVVEVEEKTFESDSELLEHSMVSSLDTDSMPEDYLGHCDALLKSFSARNLLVKKVMEYSTSNSTVPG